MNSRQAAMTVMLFLCAGWGTTPCAPQEPSAPTAKIENAPSVPAPDAGADEPGVTRIRWQPWERSTFELASRLKRPVLLYLRTADCRLCRLMERDIFDDPELVGELVDNVVPIVANADLRPDLAVRYVIGAFPTAAYLLPNAEPMYRIEDDRSLERVGAYMTDPERFRRYMGVAVRYMKRHARALRDKAAEVAVLESEVRDYSPGAPPFHRLDQLQGQIRDRADFAMGGFGRGWKTIDDAPYRLLRVLSVEQPDGPLGTFTVKTARAMLDGAIHDGVEGGFHHYSTERDWSTPSREKRLDANARALRLLIAASLLAPDDDRLRAATASTASFIRTRLKRDDGGLALAQQGGLGPDDPGTYFEADAAARETLKPPPVEPMLIGSYNADAVVALLEAGALLGDADLEDEAFRVLDFLSEHLFRKGRGTSRTLNRAGQPVIQGLLVDQVRSMEAYLLAFERRGRPGDLSKATELAVFCRDNLRRAPGYHVDRPDDAAAVGKLKRPVVDFAENGRLALALLKLSRLTGVAEWHRAAEATVGSLTAGTARVTERDAAYVEALLALRAPELRLVATGDMETPGVVELRRRGALLPRPGLAILPRLPDEGSVQGLPPDASAVGGAWLCSGERCVGPLTEADDLLARSAELFTVGS